MRLTDIITAAHAAEILMRLRNVHTQAVQAEWTWVEVARDDARDLMALLEAVVATPPLDEDEHA